MNPQMTPAQLRVRATQLTGLMTPCKLCPNECGVDRMNGELGRCGVGGKAKVAASGSHDGEERSISGTRGSGAVFFSGCALSCVFCQNAWISDDAEGDELTPEELAEIFIGHQLNGCHNLNLVTPSHQAPGVVEALAIALEEGLRLPVIWNCGGYESVEVLRLLDGIVDIYMPDLKYGDNEVAARLSGVQNYAQVSQAATKEMFRQVGDLEINTEGMAIRGLLVRHLVLPHDLAGTEAVARFIADEISTDTFVNVMDQYTPAYRAESFPEIAEPATENEFAQARRIAELAGLHRFEC